MLKRLLAVVDNSKTGVATRDLAIKLAQETRAHLTGMTVLDTPWITSAQAEPLGGAAYKLHRDDHLMRHSKHQVGALLKNFEAACSEKKVPCETRWVEGFPEKEIEYLSHEHDLILIGQTTDFNFSLEEETRSIVRHIAQDNPRPLIIVPPYEQKTSPILIAYDATLQAARSLHMFLLLGLAEGKEIHILSAHKKKNDAKKIASQAQRMCASYNIAAEVHAIGQCAEASKAILEKVDSLKIGMIVMGAFGQSSWREMIFGTTTSNLMKKSKVPLFLHH